MSKFVDSLRSESPANLWVFNQATPGTVTDQGRQGVDLTLNNSGASAKAAPSIVSGERWSVHLPVGYDYDAAGTGDYSNYSATYPEWEKIYTLSKDWTVESAFKTGRSTRSEVGDVENPVWGLYDTTAAGISLGLLETATGWQLRLQFRIDDNTVSTLVTHDLDYCEVVHAVVMNVENNFTLIVNGQTAGFGEVPAANTVHSGTYNTFVVGGVNGKSHSNTTAIASVGVIGRAIPLERAEERYTYMTERKSLDELIAGFGPVATLFPDRGGVTIYAPEIDDIFEGADSDLEYVAGTESVTVKDSSLAASFTAYKKIQVDLTEIDFLGSIYHTYVHTADAGASITSEYSFDDTNFSTLSTGVDAIEEINQVWAQAAEGSL